MPPVTVSSSANTTGLLAGDDSITAWPFTFPVQAASQLQVIHVDEDGVETVLDDGDYTVSLTDSGRSGGSVTYPLSGDPVADGAFMLVRRSMPFTQLTNLRNQGTLAPETVEAIADRVTYCLQQLREELALTLRRPKGDADAIDELPPAADRASMYLAFDADGQPVAAAAAEAEVTASAFALTLLDDADAAAARTTLGLGMTLLGDTTVTSSTATVDFTGASWTSYRMLLLVVSRAIPVTTNTNLLLRLSINAGSSWITTGYESGDHWGILEGGSGTGAGYGAVTNAWYVGEGVKNDSNGPSQGTYWIVSNSGVAQKSYHGDGLTYQDGGDTVRSAWGGYCDTGSVNAVTGIRLLFTSGNISLGRFQLYGLG
jgi:hypothetical protein